ncbi:MAG: CinA family protein [Hydrogenobaculum sp.]|nr:MAG: CinA family protein [Hydrogenobaculum sp.]HEK25369.1 CinA family protein [Hydrogenobaculum sp.]
MNFINVVFEDVVCYDDYLERLQKYLFEKGYIISSKAKNCIVINKENYNPLYWDRFLNLDAKQKPLVLRLFYLDKDLEQIRDCYIKQTPFGFDIFTEESEVFRLLKEEYKDYIYADTYESIEETVIKTLKDKSKTLVCAESCTAGMISSSLVNVAGSSQVFLGGFVVYSNDFKVNFLNVNKTLIEKHGAVSEEVVRAMALGALEYSDADISIAVSGIAGPGGSEFKPQGFTYMAIGTDENILVYNYTFKSDRNTNRRQTTAFILFRLLKDVLNHTV